MGGSINRGPPDYGWVHKYGGIWCISLIENDYSSDDWGWALHPTIQNHQYPTANLVENHWRTYTTRPLHNLLEHRELRTSAGGCVMRCAGTNAVLREWNLPHGFAG